MDTDFRGSVSGPIFSTSTDSRGPRDAPPSPRYLLFTSSKDFGVYSKDVDSSLRHFIFSVGSNMGLMQESTSTSSAGHGIPSGPMWPREVVSIPKGRFFVYYFRFSFAPATMV